MEINATLLLQLAIVLLLVGWLSGYIYGPLFELFEERERRITGARLQAKDLMRSAENQEKEINDTLATARAKARDVLTLLKNDGLTQEQTIIGSAKKDAAKLVDDARHQIKASVAVARRTLETEATSLADDVISQVLQKSA